MKRIQIQGNLTKDPTIRTTKTGKRVGEAQVAVNERVRNGDKWEDGKPEFFTVVLWENKANGLEHYKKGYKVLVDGKFSTREYDKKDGTKGLALEITADHFAEVIYTKSTNNQADTTTQTSPTQEDSVLPF